MGQAREKITSRLKGAAPRTRSPRLQRAALAAGVPGLAEVHTASLLIVASVATATSASLILYLGDIASALKDPTGALAGVDKFLTRVPSSGPQTILILGSDKDPELKDVQQGFKGLSDTTMLLRLDPDRDAIALYSLPRDLKVEIPGVGTDKLNAAYAYGGPAADPPDGRDARPELEVNHLVNVDFEGFARAVNALDCVYVDVDRRYFHSNDSTSAAADYEEIDLQPGYQALCGFDALDYARYRHTDNDIVRAARQQEFLREARAKIPPERLFRDRKELIEIFTEHTTSDINDPQTMLQVLKLFLDSRDAPIKEIHFQGTLGPSFVTATPEEIETATDQFLGIEATSKGGQTAAPEGPVTPEAAPDQTPVAPATRKAGTRAAPRAKAPSTTPSASPRPATARSSPGRCAAGCRSCRSTIRRRSRPAATSPRSRGSTRSTGPVRARRRRASAPPTSGSSRGRGSASTTASWRPVGRTRRSSMTRTPRGRSAIATTRSTSTATGCG